MTFNMTPSRKPADAQKEWLVVDATDLPLGRLASQIAFRLRGKHKPDFTPHTDTGAHIIVVNAEKVRLTGHKMATHTFFWHTGHPGGIREEGARETLKKHPHRLIERSIQRMMPRTKMGRSQMKKLHVYAGNEHPHTAQQPQQLNLQEA